MKYYRIFTIILFFALITGQVFSQGYDFTADRITGCDSLTVNFDLTGDLSSVTSVFWTFGNGNASTSLHPSAVFYETPGYYTVELIVNADVVNPIIKQQYIKVHPTPEVSIEIIYPQDINRNYQFIAPAQTADSISYTYKWWLNNDTPVAGDTSVIYQFTESGTYQVNLDVSDNSGCNTTASVIVQVDTQDNGPLKIPNVFTPNGDGRNDLFYIETDGQTIYKFRVFTRTGMLVYKSDTPAVIWDGRTPSGEEVKTGIYYYTLDSSQSDQGKTNISGFLYLFR